MKPSELDISFSVESYDKKKSAENYLNGYVAEKHIVYKLSNILIPNFNSIGNFNEDCVKISHPYILYFSRNESSKSHVRPGRAGLLSKLFR